MQDFNGQTAIVTGGTRGIGAAITRALLQRGATVTATYRSNDEAAQAFSNDLGSDRLHLRAFDVSDATAVGEAFSAIESDHPVIDILVNNSGIRRDSVLAMMAPGDWSAVIDTNLGGAYLMSKLAIQNMMRQRYGRIVNLSSPMSREAFAGQSNYSASKAGLEAMTRSVCKEVASRGITVNCVSPGFIETELLADLDEATVKSYKKMVPAKRFGKPEEVADAVCFLADRSSAYINGSVLEISGGL